MRVVVLTGAGISAESGVPTFRDADGLWEGHRVEDVATPEAFDLQPSVVHRFYDYTERNWSVNGYSSAAEMRADLGNNQSNWLKRTEAAARGQ